MILEARGLTKTYQQGSCQVHALRGVSLSIGRGEFTSIMGPSGSGKSTLLHLLGGLDRPSLGEVSIAGECIQNFSDAQLSAFRRQRLGFIFQFFNLLPTLTAVENVALPALLDGKAFKSIAPKAIELLEQMGLKDRVNHRPDEMSGGEMQRVAIARSLISDPCLILADEPTGNLDSSSGAAILELLARLAKENKQTVVMVTHDPKAASYGTRLIKMKDGLVESDDILSNDMKTPRLVPQEPLDLVEISEFEVFQPMPGLSV